MIEGGEFFVVVVEGLVNFFCCDGGGEGECARCQALGEAEKIWGDICVLAGKHFAGAAEAGCHFVGDEVDIVFRGEGGGFFQIFWGIDDHSGGAHQERL